MLQRSRFQLPHPLLDGLVDYAGLFPPASLELASAVHEYAAHQLDPETWMLGRFICPAGKLEMLLPFAELFSDSELRLCVLPGPAALLPDRVRKAAAASDAFLREFEARATVEVFESRMTDEDRGVAGLIAGQEAAGGRSLYLEWAPADPNLEKHLEEVAQARSTGAELLGVKIRCGGTEPEAFPSPEEVARFLATVTRLNIPFKATAGLHHPVRHDRDGLSMHGFLNVFGAAALALAHGLSAAELIPILEERDPAAFDLSDGGFRWRGLSANRQEIARARNVAHAYGSCSFNEPLDDLHAERWFGYQ